MDHYRQTEGYEPTADELIDVLKNLENLAAANPALYRAIVDQIKGKGGFVQDKCSACTIFHDKMPNLVN